MCFGVSLCFGQCITSFWLLSNDLDLFLILIYSTQIVFLSSKTLSSACWLFHSPCLSRSLSQFVFLFAISLSGRNQALVCVSNGKKLNENAETFQVKRFVAYSIQKALSFNISYALKKLHEKSFRRPSETNENSLLFFLLFHSLSPRNDHILLLPFN